ncbi:hypothetical protein [Deinococcus sp. YIM 77859]|uniref:hypothetical protein n=1 Tax=Deinococcus sp. YIM 77859 TaxID=1540221 RepID=UPI000555539F|nr:hypothetical protein [Deinococcus sp. YIM 77859]
MKSDLPYRGAVARDTLTRTFQEMYGVSEQQGGLLTLSVLTALVLRQQAGGPVVSVEGEAYRVGGQPVLPHVQALADLKEAYLAQYAQDPYRAHALIQQALLARLGPHAARASSP